VPANAQLARWLADVNFCLKFALTAAKYYYCYMTKSETTILESKTPADYIDRSLRARLSPAAKAKLARLWMESTGYTKEDILRARNRHPYWKGKKMEGSAERTRKRLAAHNYSAGASVQWDSKLVSEFLDLNRRGPDGRYDHKDWQLAEHFSATIPSIQYMRRKLSKVEGLLGARSSQGKVVEYLLRAESVLSRGKEAVEGFKASRKAMAPRTGGAAKKAASSASRPKPKVGRKAKAKPAAEKTAKAKPVKPASAKSRAKPRTSVKKVVRKGKKK
jgi:hypothetical protein